MSDGAVVLGHDPCLFGTIRPTLATKLDESSLVNDKGQYAREILLTVETNPCRFRIDGGAPTATVGHLLPAGATMLIQGSNAARNLALIDTAAGASVVSITVFF